MGLFNKVMDNIRTAQGLPTFDTKAIKNPEVLMQSLPHGQWGVADPSSNDYQLLYSIQSTVYRSVFVISSNMASLPIQVYSESGDSLVDREYFTDKPEFDIFKNPNPWMTSYDFWEATTGFLELTGECPWTLVRNNLGKIEMIIPLRPDKIKIVPDKKNMVSHYVFSHNNEEFRIESNEMIFLKYFNPMSDYRGLSPLKAAQMDIELDLRSISANSAMLSQGARPSGIISTEHSLSDHIWNRYRQEFEHKHSGSDKRGKIMFLDSGMKWQQIGFSQEDMQYMQQRQWTKDTVAEVYGVPPIYIMQFKEASVLANADVQYRLFWTHTVIPKAQKLATTITSLLLPELSGRDDLTFSFDFGNVGALQPDKKEKAERFEKGLKNGAVSPNDFREIVLELPRVDDEAMDTYYMQQTMIPVDLAGTQLDTPPPTPPSDDGDDEEDLPFDIDEDTEKTINKIDSYIKKETHVRDDDLNGDIYDLSDYVRASSIESEEKGYYIKTSAFMSDLEKTLIPQFAEALRDVMTQIENKILGNLRPFKAFKSFDVSAVSLSLEDMEKLFEIAGHGYIHNSVFETGINSAIFMDEEFIVSDPTALKYIENRTHQYASMVSSTMHTDINKILASSLAESLTIRETASGLNKFFTNQKVYRAQRIARTEMVSGGNYGRLRSYKQSARVGSHRWVSQRDDKTRDYHAAVDGQVVKVGADFSIGGTYVGDPTYPSDINERCFTIPVNVKPKNKAKGEDRVKGLIDDTPYSIDDWEKGTLSRQAFMSDIMSSEAVTRRQAWRSFFEGVGKADKVAYQELLSKMGYTEMRKMMHGSWLSNSQSNWGGAMKDMYAKITGKKTHYHRGFMDKDKDELKKFADDIKIWYAQQANVNNITAEMIEDFMRMEQEFLHRMLEKAGMVNADGTVTLYRGIDYDYFKNIGMDVEVGDILDFLPNSAESWSVSKQVAGGFIDGGQGYIMKADVQIDQLGMGVFNWADDAGMLMQEGEIIVNNLDIFEIELLFP